jgi:hypothetical protein
MGRMILTTTRHHRRRTGADITILGEALNRMRQEEDSPINEVEPCCHKPMREHQTHDTSISTQDSL